MCEDRSRLGLDEEQTFLERLGLFLTTLILGPLIGLMIAAALAVNAVPPGWQAVVRFIIEALIAFWGLALVFIWWRPRWLRRIYLSVERKVVWIVQGIGLLFIGAVGYFLVREALHAMGL